MKICVIGPKLGGEEHPRVFYLGARRLPIVAILGRWLDASHRYYEVSVGDGRRFVLRQEPASGQWELAAVYCASRAPSRPARADTPA
jgi:hypothetical protein